MNSGLYLSPGISATIRAAWYANLLESPTTKLSNVYFLGWPSSGMRRREAPCISSRPVALSATDSTISDGDEIVRTMEIGRPIAPVAAPERTSMYLEEMMSLSNALGAPRVKFPSSRERG